MQPKMEDKLLITPSQVMEPATSFSVTSRPRPMAVMAEVSPIVSVAETKKIRKKAKMASAWNSMVKGISLGIATKSTEASRLKSTIPMAAATM